MRLAYLLISQRDDIKPHGFKSDNAIRIALRYATKTVDKPALALYS